MSENSESELKKSFFNHEWVEFMNSYRDYIDRKIDLDDFFYTAEGRELKDNAWDKLTECFAEVKSLEFSEQDYSQKDIRIANWCKAIDSFSDKIQICINELLKKNLLINNSELWTLEMMDENVHQIMLHLEDYVFLYDNEIPSPYKVICYRIFDLIRTGKIDSKQLCIPIGESSQTKKKHFSNENSVKSKDSKEIVDVGGFPSYTSSYKDDKYDSRNNDQSCPTEASNCC